MEKSKLIKLSETHYIIVDDSEIKEGDYCLIKNEIHQVKSFNHGVLPEYIQRYGNTLSTCYNVEIGNYVCFPETLKDKKITHSTQPLEEFVDTGIKRIGWINIKPLSLLEVEELISYNVEKMAEKEYPFEIGYSVSEINDRIGELQDAYVKGFNAHKELVKNKLFTVEEMKKAIEMARQMKDDSVDDTFDVEDISGCMEVCTYGWKKKYSDEQIIQSLLPKTEWDIQITQDKIDKYCEELESLINEWYMLIKNNQTNT